MPNTKDTKYTKEADFVTFVPFVFDCFLPATFSHCPPKVGAATDPI